MRLTAKPIPKKTREMVMRAYNGYCAVEGCYVKYEADLENPVEIHHRNENSKMHNEKYPLLMQSPFMLVPLCHRHHEDGKVLKHYKYTYKQMDMMEEWLEELKGKL